MAAEKRDLLCVCVCVCVCARARVCARAQNSETSRRLRWAVRSEEYVRVFVCVNVSGKLELHCTLFNYLSG